MTDKAELLAMSLPELKATANDLEVKFKKGDDHEKIADAILAALDAKPDDETEEGDDSEAQAAAAEAKAAALKAEEEAASETDASAGDELIDETPTAKQTYIEPEVPQNKEYPSIAQFKDALKVHIGRGLRIAKLNKDYWHIQFNNREAAGTMHQPLRTIVQQANILVRPTKKPTEE